MANPMNDAFSTLLGALKKNGNDSLKIRQRPDYQEMLKEINSHNWVRHETTGDLVIDNPEMKRSYQRMIMLSGSTLLSVVQTMPTGLLKTKYIFLCLFNFSILSPSTST